MYTKNQYQDLYNETQGIDATNKKIALTNNNENQDIPYSKYSKIQLRLFDSPGKDVIKNINTKFFSGMKALIIMYDITNKNSFDNIKNNIDKSKLFFDNHKNENVNLEDNIIKQPDSFVNIPLIIVGNKTDMQDQRAVNNAEVESLIQNLKSESNFSCIKYHEISVKNNINIQEIFQDIIMHYFKRKIDINYKEKKDESNNINNINEVEVDKNEKKDVDKKPSLDKNVFVYHQMLDKIKKQILTEMTSLKEENKKKINLNKNLEEKIKLITNDFNNEQNALKEKLNLVENKNNELEEQIKLKNKEIEELNQKVNDLISSTKEITLRFKISDENDEIPINTKGETKLSEVLSMLYDLCPNINNLNIKGFCKDGNENETIDEMKTVNENKLVDGTLIVLIV